MSVLLKTWNNKTALCIEDLLDQEEVPSESSISSKRKPDNVPQWQNFPFKKRAAMIQMLFIDSKSIYTYLSFLFFSLLSKEYYPESSFRCLTSS